MATVPQFPTGTLARSALNTFVTETTTNITDANIAASANINVTKTTLGTYTAPTVGGTPTYTGTSGLTYGTVTTSINRYIQIGKRVFWDLLCTGTTGSSGAGRAIKITIPVTANTLATGSFSFFGSVNGGTTFQLGMGFLDSSTTITLYLGTETSAADWGNGANREIILTINYEAA